MKPKDRKLLLMTLLLSLAVSILALSGCRRYEQKTNTPLSTPQPDQTQTVQSDTGGEELDKLLQNLESMNRDADALDDLDTLDDLSMQDPEGYEIAEIIQIEVMSKQLGDSMDDLVTVDSISSNDDRGEELFSLINTLSVMNNSADALADLSNLP